MLSVPMAVVHESHICIADWHHTFGEILCCNAMLMVRLSSLAQEQRQHLSHLAASTGATEGLLGRRKGGLFGPEIPVIQSRLQLGTQRCSEGGYKSIHVPMRQLLDPKIRALRWTSLLVSEQNRKPGFAWRADCMLYMLTSAAVQRCFEFPGRQMAHTALAVKGRLQLQGCVCMRLSLADTRIALLALYGYTMEPSAAANKATSIAPWVSKVCGTSPHSKACRSFSVGICLRQGGAQYRGMVCKGRKEG